MSSQAQQLQQAMAFFRLQHGANRPSAPAPARKAGDGNARRDKHAAKPHGNVTTRARTVLNAVNHSVHAIDEASFGQF
jgi:hypothetical protein